MEIMAGKKEDSNRIPDFIENIFQETLLDNDCESIAVAMEPVYNTIVELLEADCNEQAARLFIQLALATANHFMADEHWTCFDDDYAPDYLLGALAKRFHGKIQEGGFSKDAMDILRKGIRELVDRESVREYGYPSMALCDNFQ